MERKASRDATKKSKLRGSFSGSFNSQSQQRNAQGGATSSGPSLISILASRSHAGGVPNSSVQNTGQSGQNWPLC